MNRTEDEDEDYGISLDGLLTADKAKALSMSRDERIRNILVDILAFVEITAKSVAKLNIIDKTSIHEIRYRANGFGSYEWNDEHEVICDLLKQLGYTVSRGESYDQFADVYLHVKW